MTKTDFGVHRTIGGPTLQLDFGAPVGEKSPSGRPYWVCGPADGSRTTTSLAHAHPKVFGHEAVDDRVEARVDEWQHAEDNLK